MLIDKHERQKLVGCKWIYKRKPGIPRVEKARYKAGLVTKDFTQREGINFNKVFSLLVKHSSIRVLLSLVPYENLELEQMDVKITFLHGELKETIYMQQPQGYLELGKEHKVCLLKKSLHGLKQYPHQRYKKFDEFMLKVEFTRNDYDNCVYFQKLVNGMMVYLLLYVDDILIISKDKMEVDRIKQQLCGYFEMKVL